MNLTYYNIENNSEIIEEVFHLSFSKKAVPFKSNILPIGLPSLTYIYDDEQESNYRNNKTPLKGLILSGLFENSYSFSVAIESESFGVTFRPSGLFKILGSDISKFTNRHIPLKEINNKLFTRLENIFLTNRNNLEKLNSSLIVELSNLELDKSKTLVCIDLAIDIIRKNEGKIQVNELITQIPSSQKKLETQFKKVIGLTPGKYIRMYRFIMLMRKYESQDIEIKDLIYQFNYYDLSHFSRDFKSFMLVSPKEFFNKDYPLIKSYLKKE